MPYQKAREKELKENQEQEAEELTYKDILVDSKLSVLLEAILEKQGPQGEALAKKILTGKEPEEIQTADLPLLERCRKELEDVTKECKELEEYITPELITEVASANAEFKKLSKLAGSEGTREAVITQIELLAITDRPKFDNIVKQIEKVQEREETIRGKEEDTKILCKKWGIDYGEYEGIYFLDEKFKDILVGVENDEGREELITEGENIIDGFEFSKGTTKKFKKQLEKAIKAQDVADRQSGLKKLIEDLQKTAMSKKIVGGRGQWGQYFGRESTIKQRRERLIGATAKQDVKHELDELHKTQKELGNGLRATFGKESVRHAFAAAMRGQELEGKALRDRASYQEARDLMLEDDDIDTEWEKEKKGIQGYDALPQVDKDARKNTFKDKLKAKGQKSVQGKTGLWAGISSAWREISINNKVLN